MNALVRDILHKQAFCLQDKLQVQVSGSVKDGIGQVFFKSGPNGKSNRTQPIPCVSIYLMKCNVFYFYFFID